MGNLSCNRITYIIDDLIPFVNAEDAGLRKKTALFRKESANLPYKQT